VAQNATAATQVASVRVVISILCDQLAESTSQLATLVDATAREAAAAQIDSVTQQTAIVSAKPSAAALQTAEATSQNAILGRPGAIFSNQTAEATQQVVGVIASARIAAAQTLAATAQSGMLVASGRTIVTQQIVAASTQIVRLQQGYLFEHNERTLLVAPESRLTGIGPEVRSAFPRAEERARPVAPESRVAAFTD